MVLAPGSQALLWAAHALSAAWLFLKQPYQMGTSPLIL